MILLILAENIIPHYLRDIKEAILHQNCFNQSCERAFAKGVDTPSTDRTKIGLNSTSFTTLISSTSISLNLFSIFVNFIKNQIEMVFIMKQVLYLSNLNFK